jgi:hypothetical protein
LGILVQGISRNLNSSLKENKMFKKLKSIFHVKKSIDMTIENRLRFKELHFGPYPNFLEKIYKRLSKHDVTLTDEEILSHYFVFSDYYRETNSFSSAETEFSAISLLCFYKPHLMEVLVRRGLLSIVYSIGDDIDATHILDFINQRILAIDSEPSGGLPPENGVIWLKEILPSQLDILKSVLEDVIEQNRREIDEM